METKIIPEIWKVVIVLPIKKPGKNRNDIRGYKPIALTVTSKKIFEKMILEILLHWNMKNNIFHTNHYGFIPFRDCEAAAYKIYRDIRRARQSKRKGFLVALDIK